MSLPSCLFSFVSCISEGTVSGTCIQMILPITKSIYRQEGTAGPSIYTTWHSVLSLSVARAINSLALFYDAKLRLRDVFIPAEFFPQFKSILMSDRNRS